MGVSNILHIPVKLLSFTEIVFLVTCNTTKFLTPPFSLAKGKCGLGMGLSNPQLASFIHSFKIHYPTLGLEEHPVESGTVQIVLSPTPVYV